MKAIVELEEIECLSLNTNKGELEAMKDFWEDKYYVEIDENLLIEYMKVEKTWRDLQEGLRELVEYQGKEILGE